MSFTVPPKPEKVVSVALDEHTVMINWTATPGALGYTVYWCPGSSKFWTCEVSKDVFRFVD